ncbi:MAG: ATP-binding protein [Candidatus Hydrothermarchaeaceae archaeon]
MRKAVLFLIFGHSLNESSDKIKNYSLQLEREVAERTKELLLLQKINNMLNIGSRQDEIFKTITEGLTSIYGYDLSAIYLLNEKGTHLICRGYSADLKIVKRAEALTRIKALNFSVPLYEGSLLSRVVEKREPVITKNIVELIKNHTENRRLKKLGRPLAKFIGIKYGIGVPLLAGDMLVGTIGVGSKEKLTKKDADTLKNFAEQVGLAVRNVKMEQELKDYSEKLEQKVEEKTKQVIHSEKLASLGQLAAGVAHELNNPLTNILLEAEALRDRQMNDETRREMLEDIISQADDAARIVKNLVEFSRQSEPDPVSVDIRDILNNSMRMASHGLNNIKLKKKYPSTLQKINGDPNQLKQVFLNIFLNAIQAMPEGGSLKSSVRVISGFIETDICDDGTGIPKEIIDKIFDPFFTTKNVGEGTGLGLSICLGIVERHGGEITVRSKEGKGSTFTVRLPISDEND